MLIVLTKKWLNTIPGKILEHVIVVSTKILVTGGMGFIGSYLVKRLLSMGYEITVLDNLYRGFKERLPEQRNLNVIIDDITNEELLKKLIEENDFVYHLAAISQVMTSIKNPFVTLQYNVEGTEKVARWCSHYNKKVIFSSSREVYGSVCDLPVNEEHSFNPENPYAASKISGEAILKAYSTTYGLQYLIFRLSNVYGGRDHGRVIPIFVEKAKNGEQLILFGDDKVMDFIYIDDVVDILIRSLNYQSNGIFNVGSGTSTTLKELAEKIISLLDSDSGYTIVQPRAGEVDRFTADISKIKRELNWKPKYVLEQGLREML
ncbi:MAG: GDP-mannose 4,6-dehydratase [Methanolobus sp.]|nr:GDP-mannose 4,6-dehydratase [Methanolobus sp.]